jgi:outer membrane protein insertion porin family
MFGLQRSLRLALLIACLTSFGLSKAQQKSNDPEIENEEISEIVLDEDESDQDAATQEIADKIIRNIIVTGNSQVSTAAILNKIPYRVGQRFDPLKTREAIRNLYYDFKRFRTINIWAEIVDTDTIDLHFEIQEKIPLKEVIFEGLYGLTEKEINEKVTSLDTPAVDTEELKVFANAIKKLYLERGYYTVAINPELIVDENGKGTIIFRIVEGPKAMVNRISFMGNRNVSSKTLRSIMYTREQWLLSFFDKSGTYLPDRLEGDKHVIEMYYQSNGYMNAKVAKITPEQDECGNFHLIFEIQEGDLYTISSVSAPGNDLMCEEDLLKIIPIKPGQPYSREKIIDAIKNLELLWGSFGYLNAHIEPSINPNDDARTVDLAFHTELGNQMTLGKLTIRGNQKTRDKIIRRQITFAEGELLTNTRMEQSKERIQSLGYFDPRDGVNWKIIRTGPDTADLDLMLKETKTGHLGFQLGFAGNPASIKDPLKGSSLQFDVGDTNFLGTGLRYNLNTRFSHEDFTLGFNITQPWLFDRPILGAFDVYHKRVAYEEFNYTTPVNEIDTGMAITSGFVTNFYGNILTDAFLRGVLGIDSIHYQPQPRASIKVLPEDENLFAEQQYNSILEKLFVPGKYGSFMFQMGQDKRNHPMHPSNGFSWIARSQVTFNFSKKCLGFQKYDIDAHWYTPLIGAYDLIFHLRGYLGVVAPFKHKFIPYRELYHIGGPASVRGFLYGEIGPQFNVFDLVGPGFTGDSIGGTKATWLNAELIFPITQDMNFKGVLFYDGGAGWDNPYVDNVNRKFIQNNHFNYRHAVGFGIRLYSPMPIKVDWGFKLDARKGEPAYEIHFNSAYEW